MEEWRDIPEYEGLYQVSNLGRIRSLKDCHGKNRKLILKERTDKDDYKRVHLFKNGKGKHYGVHRLVAIAFIPNPDNLPEVNHKDENPSNNNVENLEWCTREYNNNYGSRNKRAREKISKSMKGRYIGNKHPKAKKVKCITTNEVFESIADAKRKYNVCSSDISKCCNGKQKSAGKHPITGEKLVWKYV